MHNTDRPYSPIHPDTTIGEITLAVSDLETQVRFYQQHLGFHLHTYEERQAALGSAERVLVRLEQHPDLNRYRGVTGLYHFAIVFPNQRELARAVARLFSVKYPNSPTDHIMTKATYLDDPEGNGIELYAKSPEDGNWFLEEDNFFARRVDGSLSNGREPLDLEALFSHLAESDKLDTPLPQNTHIGHTHLHVADIEKALDFYHGVLGFDIMGKVPQFQMAFVSAGGYHHHIGLNTWQGIGAPPPPADALGMRDFSIEFPNQVTLQKVIDRIAAAGIPYDRKEDDVYLLDPSKNGVRLTTS